MNDERQRQDAERPVVSHRTMEIAVSLVLLLAGAVVAFDSYRLGARWSDDGPQSGYFPFYVALIICLCSIVTLAQALAKERSPGAVFVKRGQFRSVLAVLLPAAVYILGIQLTGIYIASALYIAMFMRWLGGYGWAKSACIGIGTSVLAFVTFEVWFKVPLPKGVFNLLGFLGY